MHKVEGSHSGPPACGLIRRMLPFAHRKNIFLLFANLAKYERAWTKIREYMASQTERETD